MVGGFNTNIRYRGRTFHIQTEDSGEANRQIITLLYEGGAILSVNKQSYENALAEGDLELAVRALMEEQHRDVLQNLKSGALDATIGLASGAGTGDSTRPQPAGACDFGEGIITDVLLGEVILAHLAAD